ncbi:putative alpha amylase, catalytic domain subfamily [Pseudomassariella vexata]|uniref:Putative alpha amylase, catalytic domain subfamily n=1 Tax=Pseudomassariella vexata TaxID=1141098 RepID=A0A1Y2E3K0_9PEZI|nr:putative alpha amylase, catalytic domain subfamily [Pseudomassariella vexata]ORY66130.1 putative alpha amylase, catalytic domain subfamily [Pseudomassariella vexata]
MASSETMYGLDLLDRCKDHFLLWMPGLELSSDPPQLVLGTYDAATQTFTQVVHEPLSQAPDTTDLWQLAPSSARLSLSDGAVYHYWFEVEDTSPDKRGKMHVTDPFAHTVDYRKGLPWKARQADIERTAANNYLVIYELPASWAKEGTDERGPKVDVGTLADVRALFDPKAVGDMFRSVETVNTGAILLDLGINALELLPLADTKTRDEWGYASAHYFAVDTDLGSSSQLVGLVDLLHEKGIRFFTDVVMAFGHDPYGYIDFDQYHLRPDDEKDNPDAYQSHTSGVLRDAYGGQSWRYLKTTKTYDPETGQKRDVHPSWAFHQAHLTRWMTDFGVDGLRLDSVNNVGNWDFVRSYKEKSWSLFNSRYAYPDTSRFLVVGEEFSMPVEMISSGYLNALWNDPFQVRVRAAILGKSARGDNFEWTIRKMIDCTLNASVPFTDGAQAINYITFHDVEGIRKERLCNFLENNQIWDKEKRAKLAFACLLTAVGIPMIFAGEEFCDEHDLPIQEKQVDPVNYSRKSEPWRSDVFEDVANLVKFRKKTLALGDVDTEFIHVDSSRGGKIMAWKRGAQGHAPVVVVANFSGESTPGQEYYVPNWPDRERDDWREITQGRAVPREWVGREPLMEWEAKIYTY